MMTPQRWQKLQHLFEQSVHLDPEAREKLLATACGDDLALKEEVLALLHAHHRATQLEQRIDDAIGGTLYAPDLAAGQIVGRFKVARLLGRGGMGTVYLAERADEQYRQNVALKIVTRGLIHGELPLRFRAERQILARLDHANIARLIDGGQMLDGTPFIVMEYVEGKCSVSRTRSSGRFICTQATSRKPKITPAARCLCSRASCTREWTSTRSR